jgi:hypothetical protein
LTGLWFLIIDFSSRLFQFPATTPLLAQKLPAGSHGAV